MQLSSPTLLKQFSNVLQGELFPAIASATGPLSKHSRLLISIVSLVPLAAFAGSRAPTGRPRRDRQSLIRSFLAKAVYNITTTRQLLDRLRSDEQLRRLCGWDSLAAIPAESTFSRAFAAFAAAGTAERIHETIIRNTQQNRTFDYIARDATAIEARERFPEKEEHTSSGKKPKKAKPPTKSKKKQTKKQPRKPFGPYRRKEGSKKEVSIKESIKEGAYGPNRRAKTADRGTRIERQHHMTLDAMLADLPRNCSIGVKRSSKGHQQYWRGYKLHWDVASNGRIPISCTLTAASLHDSQVAIPLMEISKRRVKWLCDVMDSAYDAAAIREKCKQLKHEALIQPPERPNSKEPAVWTDEQKERFKIRTIVEQQNGRLKDEFGGRIIYVRGATKVMAHLMFGIVALTVDQIMRNSKRSPG
jgi:hypothetical protein